MIPGCKYILKLTERIAIFAILIHLLSGCSKNESPRSVLDPPISTPPEVIDGNNYSGVPKSTIYSVSLTERNNTQKSVVFENSCPTYQEGFMNMTSKDKFTFDLFKGNSINWTSFPLSGSVTVEVKLLDLGKVSIDGAVKIFPSRYGIVPIVEGDIIRFALAEPGQYSVEIGDNGYKNGLMIFADPPETDIPDTLSGNYIVLKNMTPSKINVVTTNSSGLYFKKGVQDIGVYKVPTHIKNIYLESGSWVYGSLIMDDNPGVKIWGRGVLSSARLNYRESHCIETINGSNNVDLEGIVIADTKYYAVRMIGGGNKIDWVKVVGGWVVNTDGIRVGKNSTISNCFIRANDDNLKVYRDNITISNVVCWQMNEGAVIQLGWGNARATNVKIVGLDILHTQYNTGKDNRGVIGCVGDRDEKGGMFGLQKDFLIQNVVTETPILKVFNIAPNPASPNEIHGMVFKNWDIKYQNKRYSNYLECSDPGKKFDGLVFDNVSINGTKLTASNWVALGNFKIKDIEPPTFY